MKIIHDSLLEAPKDFAIVHCISADCAMGITSDGREIPCLALTLRNKYPELVGYCKLIAPSVGMTLAYKAPDGRIILNMVTKEKYHNKPTYTTLLDALCDLRNVAILTNTFKLAIPRLGSGLDRLNWIRVSKIIDYVFEGAGIEIVLYDPKGLVGTRPHTVIMDEVNY